MISIFIIINGSNDLYSSVNNGIYSLYKNIENYKNKKIYFLYSMIESNPLKLWKKCNEKESLLKGYGAFKYFNGKIEDINVNRFYRKFPIEDKKVKVFAPDLFLKEYLKKEDINIVFIGGHGGPFQSLLDMSQSPSISVNTVLLCKRIREFKIDFLFLDMCAMNYVEVIYELLITGNIENIMTYKNYGPFAGVNYEKILDGMIRDGYFDKNKYYNFDEAALILINKEKINKLESLKKLQSELIKKVLTEKYPTFDEDIKKFEEILNSACEENSISKMQSGNSLNFIRYYLNDKVERKLYNKYDFTTNNLWRFMVSRDKKNYKNYNPECIKLAKDSIESIIYLHNSSFTKDEIDKKVEEFIKYRNEEKNYSV